jgi:hypothetical protein
MNLVKSRFALRLAALLAALSLTFFTGAKSAVAQSSDQLVISVAGGGPTLFQNQVAEGAAPGTEPSLAWDPTHTPGIIPAGGVVPPGGLGAGGSNLIANLLPLPGINYVIVAEPPNELQDANALPLPVYTGPGGPVLVSDVLINGLNNAAFQAGQFIPFISLVSDNNPDLTELVNGLNGPIGGAITGVVPEANGWMDLTPFIGANAIPGLLPPVQVQVMSPTPEPSTFVLAGLGAVAILMLRRRRAATA